MADRPAKPPRKRRKLLWIVGGILVTLLLCVVVAVLSNGDKEPQRASDKSTAAAVAEKATAAPKPTKTPIPSKTPKPTATPIPTPTEKPISAITYQEIREKREAATDAQWDEYAKPLKGTRVQWSGWVAEVKASGEIWIDMDPPDTLLSVQDVYIRVPAEDATKFNLDQEIEFIGDIKSITSILNKASVTLENVTVLE